MPETFAQELQFGPWASGIATETGTGFKRRIIQPSSGATWTPSSPAATLGMWFQAGVSTCFTDTGGTTPVAADNDLVACIKSSANGAILFTQATAGNRPKYRTGAGKPYLEFDGVDDFLGTPSVVTLTDGSGQHSICTAAYFANNTGNQSIMFSAYTNGLLQLNNNASAATAFAYNAAGGSQSDAGPAITAAAGTVISELSSTTTVEAFVNGTGNGSTARSGTPYASTDSVTLGSVNGASQLMTGRIYGFAIWKGLLTAPEHASAVSYFGALY